MPLWLGISVWFLLNRTPRSSAHGRQGVGRWRGEMLHGNDDDDRRAESELHSDDATPSCQRWRGRIRVEWGGSYALTLMILPEEDPSIVPFMASGVAIVFDPLCTAKKTNLSWSWNTDTWPIIRYRSQIGFMNTINTRDSINGIDHSFRWIGSNGRRAKRFLDHLNSARPHHLKWQDQDYT